MGVPANLYRNVRQAVEIRYFGNVDLNLCCFNLYRKCVELDPSMELAYRRLMLSLKANGHRHEAVDVYLRYQQSLRANLSMEPSPETEAVYRDLLKN